jgi:prepilin-type N-terminal cleavage/methylation domain-containing protein
MILKKIKIYQTSGFSLSELLVVIALIAILGTVIFSNFYTRKGRSTLNLTTNQIASILTEARNRAIAQDRDLAWGVYFENSTSTIPFYALFYSNSYSTSTTIKKYTLPNLIFYGTSTIPLGGSLTILFNKISGNLATLATTTTIYLNLIQGNKILATSSISISRVGVISY